MGRVYIILSVYLLSKFLTYFVLSPLFMLLF